MIRTMTAAIALALVAGGAQAQDRHTRGDGGEWHGQRGGDDNGGQQGGDQHQGSHHQKAAQTDATPPPPAPAQTGGQGGRGGHVGGGADVRDQSGQPQSWSGRHVGPPQGDLNVSSPPAGGQTGWNGSHHRGGGGGTWNGGQPGVVQGDVSHDNGGWRRHGDGGGTWNGNQPGVVQGDSRHYDGSHNGDGDRGDRDGRGDGRRGDGSQWNGWRESWNANGGQGWNGQRGGHQPGAHAPRYRDRGRSWYDQNRYRQSYWASHRYRIRPYIYPRGWFVQRWSFGDYLPYGWYTTNYYLDAWAYGLPQPPIGCEWVRVGSDALLVDVWSGEILSVYYNLFFW